MADEVAPEIISSTQKLLGRYVKRPVLAEKLLRKPPFRFLHDIINTVIKETGFLKGLFTESELNYENVKEREAKIAFLNKLITAVKTLSNKELKVRASKVIAGLEPEETNKLLQSIAKCIDKKVDSKEYISSLKEGTKKENKEEKTKKKTSELTKGKVSKVKSKTSPNETVAKTKSKSSKTTKVNEPNKVKDVTPKAPQESKPGASPKIPEESKPKDASPKSPQETPEDNIRNEEVSLEIKKEEDPEDKNAIEEVNGIQIDNVIEQEAAKAKEDNQPKLERPKSARPRSGDYSKPKEVPTVRPEPLKATHQIETPSQSVENSVSKDVNVTSEIRPPSAVRPKSSLLRPPSVRPSSARPGAPRLRPDSAIPMKEIIPLGKINVIVENYDQDANEKDEEETVVIQNVSEEMPDTSTLEKTLDIPADKGHLVEQILEQINGTDLADDQIKSNLDWENQNVGKDSIAKEISALKTAIQALTKTANPLGKLMSYLHEDVEAMHVELEGWLKMKRFYTEEISKQKKIIDERNSPLLQQLKLLDESKKIEQEAINVCKYNILRNEEKIKDLVLKQITFQ